MSDTAQMLTGSCRSQRYGDASRIGKVTKYTPLSGLFLHIVLLSRRRPPPTSDAKEQAEPTFCGGCGVDTRLFLSRTPVRNRRQTYDGERGWTAVKIVTQRRSRGGKRGRKGFKALRKQLCKSFVSCQVSVNRLLCCVGVSDASGYRTRVTYAEQEPNRLLVLHITAVWR